MEWMARVGVGAGVCVGSVALAGVVVVLEGREGEVVVGVVV